MAGADTTIMVDIKETDRDTSRLSEFIANGQMDDYEVEWSRDTPGNSITVTVMHRNTRQRISLRANLLRMFSDITDIGMQALKDRAQSEKV